ncbi:hypothetical protein, partial [Candidatus Frankia alpina]|uniref:hypothetical protein n=1 Tax=Candidatus Frankia alpina TaxID=2699483 RepID=UPI001A993178
MTLLMNSPYRNTLPFSVNVRAEKSGLPKIAAISGVKMVLEPVLNLDRVYIVCTERGPFLIFAAWHGDRHGQGSHGRDMA